MIPKLHYRVVQHRLFPFLKQTSNILSEICRNRNDRVSWMEFPEDETVSPKSGNTLTVQFFHFLRTCCKSLKSDQFPYLSHTFQIIFYCSTFFNILCSSFLGRYKVLYCFCLCLERLFNNSHTVYVTSASDTYIYL